MSESRGSGPPPLPFESGIAEELEPELEQPIGAGRDWNLNGRTVRQHAARGMVINTGFLTGLSVLGLIRGFALAAFLTREDYGVWGILAVSLGTLLWLKQVGIGDKYIQQDDEDQELAFQKAFTLEAIFTGIFMVLLAAALPVFAIIYNQWKLVPPGLVIVLLLPAGVLQAPLWIYARKMDFLRQRTLQSIDPVVGFVVAITMAALGAGYWALAAGVLAGGWSAAIAAVIVSPYKLRFRYDKGTLHSYASFSWPLFVANGSTHGAGPGRGHRGEREARARRRGHDRPRLDDHVVHPASRRARDRHALPGDLRGQGPAGPAARDVREVQPPGADVGDAVRHRIDPVLRRPGPVRHRATSGSRPWSSFRSTG